MHRRPRASALIGRRGTLPTKSGDFEKWETIVGSMLRSHVNTVKQFGDGVLTDLGLGRQLDDC
jgi:hypothetical protein